MARTYKRADDERVAWIKAIPFILMHLLPIGIIWTGISWKAAFLGIFLYFARMFFVTAGFHRYFAHRGYEMGRVMQFIMAFGATTAAQKGPLWWSGYHRHHHRFSDTPKDIHSPLKGAWWSHVGWILARKYKEPRLDLIKDFAKYPELQWLTKHYLIPPTILAAVCLIIAGWQGLFVGFFLSTIVLYHGVFLINSVMHLWGRRRYVTTDTSRNSLLLALITLGEGWHNNHHYYRSSANQGFFWWEIDITYYILKLLSKFGLVSGLRNPPENVLKVNRVKDGVFDVGMFQNKLIKAQAVIDKYRERTGDMYEAKKGKMEEILENAKVAAEEVARKSKGPMKQ